MKTDSIDPITFEVLNNGFKSIVDEMGALIQAVAFSLVVSEGRDYSGTICTAAGDLVSSGSADLPGHLGTIPFTVKGALEWIGKAPEHYFRPGDVLVVNDGYIGGTHNNDVRTMMPVFVDGRLIAFVQDSAHWTDIGGHVPGSFDPNAKSSHGEGLVISPVKIVRAGELDRDLARLILRNVRMPEIAYGDLLAQIGACRLGAKRLEELAAKYGTELVLDAMSELIHYSERMLRSEFEKLPDGVYSWSSWIDRDPGSDSAERVEVALDVTISGDRAIYDFSRSSPEARGAINAPRSVCVSSAIATTKAIFPHVPMNQGAFNAIDFVIPPGRVISAAYPAPISGMGATCFPAVENAVLGCFIQMAPERSMAGTSGLVNVTFGGYDPRPDVQHDYVAYLWLEGGWGARPAKKDNGTAIYLIASSATNQPIEMHERLFPVLYETYAYEPDSAGPGRHRGGSGVTKAWRLTHGEAILSVLGNQESEGPWGYAGGLPARPNVFRYAEGTDEETNIGMFRTGMRIEAGRTLRLSQAGGGGYGDPLQRPVEWVVEDLEEGLVTVDHARDAYGVIVEVLDEEERIYRLDSEATARRREQTARNRDG